MTLHPFDRDLTLDPTEIPGQLGLNISDQWSIANTPNGGYIMALMAQGLRRGFKAGHACIVTANYMDRCLRGPGTLAVETMGESGSYLRKQARLIQEGRERIRAWATLVRSEGGAIHQETRPQELAPVDQCLPVPPMEGFTLYNGIDLRLDPSCAGWMKGETGRPCHMKGWIRFRRERVVDVPAVTLFCDCFPPCVFNRWGMNAWVPTLEYSVNLRQLPRSLWLKGFFRSRVVSAGLVEEDGELWDTAGNLVALSRQVSKYQIPRP